MYVKLFSELLDSSVWAEDDQTRLVWIALLLMADPDGMVRAAAPGIAHRARVPLAATVAALEHFQQPDEHSRTLDNDGTRISRVPGGYMILNYVRYRNMRDEDARRTQMREYMRKWRKSKRADAPASIGKHPLASVSISKHPLAHTEAEAEAEAEAELTRNRRSVARVDMEKQPARNAPLSVDDEGNGFQEATATALKEATAKKAAASLEPLFQQALPRANPRCLTEWALHYPAEWIHAALQRAVEREKPPGPAWVTAILKAYQREGGPDESPPPALGTETSEAADASRRLGQEMAELAARAAHESGRDDPQ